MRHFIKRLIDITIACGVLFFSAPVMLVIVPMIRIKCGSPVLFKQERPGLNEKPFTLYKFRTMRNDYDENGNLLPDEDRMTGIGTILRKLSLDELPQFINVLKGEMSLIGPRPLLMQYLPLYNETQKHRHDAKPGITGWAQVNGRNAISWEEKFQLDVWYVQNWSLTLDFKIMFMTAWKIFKREGISAADSVTMHAFTGSPSETK